MKKADKQQPDIDLLAKKLLNGTIIPIEREQLDAWYSDNATKPPIWELKNETKDQLSARIYTSILSKIDLAPSRHGRSLFGYLAIAALFLVICGIGIVVWTKSIDTVQSVRNVKAFSNGMVTKVHLPDHSIVWLKGNSRLDYPSKFSDSTRSVTLHGEALFEVAKDRRHPFIITTERYITRVLGTSFNIDAANQEFRITVLTGKVTISEVTKTNAKPATPVTVTPGNQFESTAAESIPKVLPSQANNMERLLKGTEYNMNFENSGFEEIKTRIENKFNVRIIASKNTYKGCTLSADLTDQSLENTLKVISTVINAQFKIDKDQIEFTGGGCN